MSSSPDNLPIVKSVLHPTDMSPESESAFQHALAIALLRQTSLTLLHVGKPKDASSFPSVRETLERWGLLEKGSARSEVYDKYRVRIKKVVVSGRPLPAILEHLDRSYNDLVVLASSGGDGGPRWLKPSVSEPLAHRSETSTLFVPAGGEGIVDPDTGRFTIRRILVPVAQSPDGQNAVTLATRTALAARQAHGEEVEIRLVHVGDSMPELQLAQEEGIHWTQSLKTGDVIDSIIESSRDLPADLIVMAADGRNGILDAFRGSHSEQILRRTPCPLLVVPITAHEMPVLLA